VVDHRRTRSLLFASRPSTFGQVAMLGSAVRAGAVALGAALLCACAGGERPTKLVQLCVRDDEGIRQLKSELAAIAKDQQLEFSDNGDAVKRDLEAVGYTAQDRKNGGVVVSLTARRKDGMGLSALNVGLFPYQIALGFSTGKDRAESSKFAEDVVARLRQRWSIEDVRAGAGVTPNANCR
jgi:hypothetical protein